jgi:prepilin peptidase CpaA
MNESLLAHALLLVIAGCAAFTDLRSGHIPNWITLPPLLVAPLVYLLVGGPTALLSSLFGALVCAAVPALVFFASPAGMGGGDVKLLAAIGALAGAYLGIEIELYSFLAISAYALLLLAWRGQLRSALRNSVLTFLNLFLPRERRWPIVAESMTTLRLGGAILVASLYCLTLQHAELWP